MELNSEGRLMLTGANIGGNAVFTNAHVEDLVSLRKCTILGDLNFSLAKEIQLNPPQNRQKMINQAKPMINLKNLRLGDIV